MKVTVILFLIASLLTYGAAFTVSSNLACNADALRVNKISAFDAQVTDFTDNVYEIGSTSLWTTSGQTTTFHEVILLRSQNTFKAHAIGSDLTVNNQTYTATVPVKLLQVIEHIIFVQEYTADMSSYKYAAYLFDAQNVASTELKRVEIEPLTSPAGLKFIKVLKYDSEEDILYVVMGSESYTQIQGKSLATNGPFETQIPVTDSKAHISVGNDKLLFDGEAKQYYRFTSSGSNFEQLPIKTSDSGSQFGPILSSNLKFYQLVGGSFAITSFTGTAGTIQASFGLFEGLNMLALGEDTAGTGTFAPVIHSDKYNFIFISENIFSFGRFNSKLTFTDIELSELLTATELTEAKADFKDAYKVAFNVEKQFILNQDSITIYELGYNTEGSQVVHMNKLASLALSSDVSELIMDDSNVWIKLRIKCTCARVLVTKLKCFSNRFKCLGINSYIPDDCTAPYVDSVPEFATA